jgi:hypothetical protein
MTFKIGDRVTYFRTNGNSKHVINGLTNGLKKGIVKEFSDYAVFITPITEKKTTNWIVANIDDVKLDVIGQLKYLRKKK